MSDNIPETMMEQKSHCKRNRETCLYKGTGCYEKHKEKLQKMACSRQRSLPEEEKIGRGIRKRQTQEYV